MVPRKTLILSGIVGAFLLGIIAIGFLGGFDEILMQVRILSANLLAASASSTDSKISALGIKSVLDFGAKGDGVTDDSNAFIAAFGSGGVLYIPGNKTYLISQRVSIPRELAVFSDSTATIKMSGNGNFLISKPFVRISKLNIDAAALPASGCVFTLNTGVIDAKLRMDQLKVSGSPCFFNEWGTNQYFDVDFRNIAITGARGTQFVLTEDFAYLQLANISIAGAPGLSVPLISAKNNQGAFTSGLTLSGSSSNANNNGIALDNSIAWWIPGVTATGLGGSAIYGVNSQDVYMRNIVVNSSGSCIVMSGGNNIFTYNLSGTTCKNGAKLSGVSKSAQTSGTTIPDEPADLMAQNEKDEYQSLLNDDYVSVVAYGAPGDGVTDAAPAFARAIATGKNVYVPYTPNGYALHSTVTIDKPVSIVAPEPVMFTSTTGALFNITSSNVTIQGVRANPPAGKTGISAFTVTGNSTLSNITLQDMYLGAYAHILSNESTPLSRFTIDTMIVYGPTDIALHLYNLTNSVLRRVTVSFSGSTVSPAFAGIRLETPTNVLLRETTVGGFGGGTGNENASGFFVHGGSGVYFSQSQGDTTNGHGVWIDGTKNVVMHEMISGLNYASDFTFTNGAQVTGVDTYGYARSKSYVPAPSSALRAIRAYAGSAVNLINVIVEGYSKSYDTDTTVTLDTSGNKFVTTSKIATTDNSGSTGSGSNGSSGNSSGSGNTTTGGAWNWNYLGTTSTDFATAGIGDLNGDGKSEVLFRNNGNGQFGFGGVTGGVFGVHILGDSSPAYTVVGVADFNKDNIADVAFRNNANGEFGYDTVKSDGTLGVWRYVAGSNTSYSIVALGDFNRDSTPDFLFRDGAGNTGYDYIKGTGVPAWQGIGGSTPAYAVAGVGDFTGDGIADILFRNASGDLGDYEITSSSSFIWHHFGATTASYATAGIGDFNGDGIPDLGVRDNSTGAMGYYEITRSAKIVWHSLGASSPSYKTVGVGDFNGDHLADMMLRDASGAIGYYSVIAPTTVSPVQTQTATTASTAQESNTSSSVITIPVRILMLQSSDPSVQTTLSDAQIQDIFNNSLGVNEHYWKQANIQFKIESIVKATPRQVSGYPSNLPRTYADVIKTKTYQASFANVIAGLTPTSGLLEGGFNVVVVHDFGSMGGGLYLSNKSNKVAYVPEQSIKGSSSAIMTFAFAHELGHALGLVHYDPKVDPYNLMAISDPTLYNPQNKTHLVATQISTAYSTAKTGHPGTPQAGQTGD